MFPPNEPLKMKETINFWLCLSPFRLLPWSWLSVFLITFWFHGRVPPPIIPHLIKPYHLCFVLLCLFNNSLDLILWSTAGGNSGKFANWVLCELGPPCSAIFLFNALINLPKVFSSARCSAPFFNLSQPSNQYCYSLHKDSLLRWLMKQNIRYFSQILFPLSKNFPSFQQMAPARKIGKKGHKNNSKASVSWTLDEM